MNDFDVVKLALTSAALGDLLGPAVVAPLLLTSSKISVCADVPRAHEIRDNKKHFALI